MYMLSLMDTEVHASYVKVTFDLEVVDQALIRYKAFSLPDLLIVWIRIFLYDIVYFLVRLVQRWQAINCC